MNFRALAARFALVASCGLMATTPAMAHFWECVTFARSVSGIDIHGNANTWWSKAAGHYQRGHTPEVGAVMSFEASGRMRMGHVAMVSKVIDNRDVLLTHANWSRPGAVEHDVRAVDVSPVNDWSQVKVWYAPTGDLGTTVYPVNGFIYANGDSSAATAATASAVLSADQKADQKTHLANVIALAAIQRF
jgi:surface antigen